MPQNDPIGDFIALPRDQQLATLQALPRGKQDQLLLAVKVRRARQPYKGPAPMQGSSFQRFTSSAVAPFKGVAELFNGAPTEEEKKQGLTSIYDAALRPIERLVESQTGQVGEAENLAKQGRYSEAAGHALASVVPLIGPWVADTAQQFYGQLGRGDVAGALGTAAGNTALALTPIVKEKTKGLAPRVKESVRSSLKRGAGIHPLDIRKQAQSTFETNEAAEQAASKKNADLAAKHNDATRDALDEIRQREDLRRHAVSLRAEEIADNDAADAASIRMKHEKAVDEARQHNANVRRKHAAVTERIRQENLAEEHMARLRQQKEEELQKATNEYRAREQAEDAKAKAAENQAWSVWRGKMKEVTIDGGTIAAPLNKLRLDSPEVDRTLNQLEPRGDEVPQESPYARLRDETSRSNFGQEYDALSPEKQDAVDTMMVRSGESPEPINLDPQEGQPISVERVQRASSILQRYIRSGRFEGPLLGEMKQVAKVLRRAVSAASEEHGAADDLDLARSETVRYNQAFGRERPEPKTGRGQREKNANPEEVKRLQEEERLEALRKYNPSLADAQQKVRDARDELRKLPSEDQLRKAQKQIPAAPSTDHPFEAYRLKMEPLAPAPRLTSGSPVERANQIVPMVERVEVPDRPTQVIAPRKNLNTGEISAEQARLIREEGMKLAHARGAGVARGISTWALAEAIRGEWKYAAALFAARLIISLPRAEIGVLLENPKIADWLSKPTKAELGVYRKLTPEQKSVFDGSLQRLTSVARSKGMKVSPLWRAITSGALGGMSALPAPRAQNPTDAWQGISE